MDILIVFGRLDVLLFPGQLKYGETIGVEKRGCYASIFLLITFLLAKSMLSLQSHHFFYYMITHLNCSNKNQHIEDYFSNVCPQHRDCTC